MDGLAHLPAGDAPPGARYREVASKVASEMASIGVKGSPHVDDPCNDSASHMETKVTDVLKSVASLAGASRALAAALVRAGALGAAAGLAQRFVLTGAHGDAHEHRAAPAAWLMQEVLSDVGRHVPEVCTPCTIPCLQVALARAGALSGAGAAPGGPAAR